MTDLTTLPADCLFTSQSGEAFARMSSDRFSVETLTREFDAVDTKGRRFGARVYINRETRVAKAGSSWLTKWLGTKVSACPQALRDGEKYGALQSTHYFDTEEEAYRWADRYFRDAEKRALKNKARAA